MLCAAAFLAPAGLIEGCGPSPNPAANPVPEKSPEIPRKGSTLSFSTDTPSVEGQQAMLANAEFTFAIQADGLPAEMAQVAFRGDYSNDPEEKMVWQSLKGIRPRFTFSGKALTPEGGSQYQQGIDTRNGAIVTTWTQPGVGKVEIKTMGRGLHYTSELTLTPETHGELTAEPMSKVNTGQAPGIRYTGMTFRFVPELVFAKFLPCEPGTAVTLLLDAQFTHKGSEPTNPSTPEIALEGPAEDQAAINNLAFQVTGYSIGPGPFGLTNDRYFGHVFWDADVWVFPALSLLDPGAAKRIPDYRLATVEGAKKNYQKWIREDRPIAGGKKLGPANPVDGGMKFAWESGETGVETAPGDSRFQEHISGSVVLGLQNACALGLANDRATLSVEKGVYAFYEQRIEPHKSDSATWSMPGVMSPDEFHIGDNDLYTNLVAQISSKPGSRSQETAWKWTKPLLIPKDELSLLNYEDDELRAYQQAAGLLAVYPLQDPEAEKQAIDMLDRFGPKVIKNGPAMSHSLHALIRARFGDADQAHEEWKTAYDRYAKPPFGYISERPTTHQTVFVTGAAGFLNTVLYGFAGIRVDEKPWPDAQWKVPLKNGWWISGRANLPSKWKSLTIKDLKILDKSYTLKITQDGSMLTPNPTP